MTTGPEQRSLRKRNILIGVVVVAVVALLLALWNREALVERFGTPAQAGGTDLRSIDTATPPAPGTDRPEDAPGEAQGLERSWSAAIGSPPVWPQDLSSPLSCDAVDRARHEVCAALDARTDPDLIRRTGGACNLFETAARQLVARPPEIDSELGSHGAILANVFHLFRVLGRERLDLLRTTLAEGDQLREALALTTYRWLVSRENCAPQGDRTVSVEALYPYAGFVFNTLGGQAYLRRRAPRTEALACFYALQVLDLAVEQKHNPLGLDPREEIGRCRELVESQPLVFAERYARVLGRMSERWEAKTGR